jgi:hypothetical protein
MILDSQVTIINKGEWLRRKVQQAVAVWRLVAPEALPRMLKVAKEKRAGLYRKNGCSQSGDLSGSFVMPRFLHDNLMLTEEQTYQKFGSRFGIGQRCWANEDELMDIVMRELPELKISDLWGAPSRHRS